MTVKGARGLADFQAKHDPLTIIARLEAELREANERLGLEAAIKELLGTTALNLEARRYPKWLGETKFKKLAHGTPTLLLSDFHWGERVFSDQVAGVNDYSLAIARARLRRTVEVTVALLKMLDPTCGYPGIVVALGGDMVSGSLHEELSRTNEAQEMKVLLDLVDNLIPAIDFLADAMGNVFLPCVSGNHGRNSRKTWAKDRNATSFDWLLYQFLARHFAKDARVRFYIPEGQDAIYSVHGTRYLLTHGDTLGHGGDGMIGFLGPVTRGDHKRRTRQQQINQPYDVLLAGHWHQYVQTRRLVVNGSLKGYCEYAYTEAFPFEPPQQALWITHPENGITWRMPVMCEKPKSRTDTPWVSAP